MNQSYVRLVKLLKMTVRTSVLWKMKIHMAKKWPEKVVQRSFIKEHSFPNGLYFVSVHSGATRVEAANRGATQWVGHVIKIEKQ